MLDLNYILSWKSKEVYEYELKPLYTVFFNSIRYSGHRIGLKFDKDPLAVRQNNYLTKFVNVYIVYDLDTSPRNATYNFKFKNGLFGSSTVVKNSGKEKYVYSGYGIMSMWPWIVTLQEML